MRDYIKLSSLLLYRDKKKVIYSIVILICCIVSASILIFNCNVEKLLNHGISNNIGFRTIVVMPRNSQESSDSESQLQKDFADLQNIEHVIDVYDGRYREVSIDKSSFSQKGLDGTMTLSRGTPNTIPTVISGRGFLEGEKNVAICPTDFFPNANPTLVNKKYVIDGNELLGKDFTISYYDYILDSSQQLQENKRYNSTFKIIGLYDTSERLNDNSVCYVPADNLIEIVDIQESVWSNQNTNDNPSASVSISVGIDVIVDNLENVESVANRIKELGFEISGYGSTVDTNMINTIHIVIILVLCLTLFGIIVISNSYVQKKINSEEKNIAVLRASGFSRKTICYLYTLKQLIHHFIIYTFSIFIVLIAFWGLVNHVPFLVGIDLLIGGIKIGVYPFVFSFLVVVIIPSLISAFVIIKKFNTPIIKLFSSKE